MNSLMYLIFPILLIISAGATLLNKQRIKRWLCKGNAIYEDGKLKVPAIQIGLWAFLFLAFTYLVALLLTDLIQGQLALKTVGMAIIALALLIGAILLIGIILKMLWNTALCKAIVTWLAQRMEFTCERITFSDEVKAILASIEALNPDAMAQFRGGLKALDRKLEDDFSHTTEPQVTTKKPVLSFLAVLSAVLFIGSVVVAGFYIADRPKMTIDESMLGTDIVEGKVLYIGQGEAPARIDYIYRGMDFGKSINKIKRGITK